MYVYPGHLHVHPIHTVIGEDKDVQDSDDTRHTVKAAAVKIILVSGFESFNVGLYKKVAVRLSKACPGATLYVFSDRDIASNRAAVEGALNGMLMGCGGFYGCHELNKTMSHK